MGSDKSTLIHLSGVTYLQHSLDRLQMVCDGVVVSTRTATNKPPTLSPVQVHDLQPDLGPAMGVTVCLQHAHSSGYDACLVTPVDMPHLTVADLLALRDEWSQCRHLPVCGITSTEDRLQPLVAIYPVQCVDSLEALVQSEHRSLRRWLASHLHRTVALPARSCRNVNSPEDLSTESLPEKGSDPLRRGE